jgi:hypothetical protein
MAPIYNTIFAVSLFLVLAALLVWTKRRRRASDSAHRVDAGMRASLRG